MITNIKKTSKIEALSRDWTHKRALKSQKKKKKNLQDTEILVLNDIQDITLFLTPLFFFFVWWPEGLMKEIWMESTGNFLQFTVWDSYSSDRSVDIYENLWEHTDLFYNL